MLNLGSGRVSQYVVNWVIDFLSGQKQRLCLDNARAEFVSINRRVPQRTVLGPTLFLVMVNDIKRSVSTNFLVEFADDITFSVPLWNGVDDTVVEVGNILQ